MVRWWQTACVFVCVFYMKRIRSTELVKLLLFLKRSGFVLEFFFLNIYLKVFNTYTHAKYYLQNAYTVLTPAYMLVDFRFNAWASRSVSLVNTGFVLFCCFTLIFAWACYFLGQRAVCIQNVPSKIYVFLFVFVCDAEYRSLK